MERSDHYLVEQSEAWGPFLKCSGNFSARKAIFSSSVSKNDGEVHAPQTSCMKKISVHIVNMWIKQLCNHTVWDFATAFRTQNLFEILKEEQSCRSPAPVSCPALFSILTKFDSNSVGMWSVSNKLTYSCNCSDAPTCLPGNIIETNESKSHSCATSVSRRPVSLLYDHDA